MSSGSSAALVKVISAPEEESSTMDEHGRLSPITDTEDVDTDAPKESSETDEDLFSAFFSVEHETRAEVDAVGDAQSGERVP